MRPTLRPPACRASRIAPAACALATLLATLLASCVPSPHPSEWASVREVTPAPLQGLAAWDANLALGPRGQLALTWVTRDSLGASVWLVVSADSGEHFGAARRLDEPAGSVSSYAESRPVAAFGPSGQLVVAWAARRDSSGQADDIVTRASADGGVTFEPPAFVNDDHADPESGYHGFATLDFGPDGRAYVAWLDGRSQELAPDEDEPARAEVRLAVSLDEGRSWQPSTRVADEACPCCHVVLHADSIGHVVVAYRGARDDLRDPRLAVSSDRGATFALDTLIAGDRWKLPGCPSIGPAITMNRAGGGHYAWFTGAERAVDGIAPGVYVVPWRLDAGTTGPRRALTDSLKDASRPMLAPLATTTLAGVIGRPRADSTRRVLAVRAIEVDGTLTPWMFLGAGVRSAALAGAGPRRAYAAWIEQAEDVPHLRLVRLERL
jgi:hypothetical protein